MCFQVTIENVGDVFYWDTVYIRLYGLNNLNIFCYLFITRSFNVYLIFLKFLFFLEQQCFSTRRLWLKQRSSLAIVIKLQFICINFEFVYICRQRSRAIYVMNMAHE